MLVTKRDNDMKKMTFLMLLASLTANASSLSLNEAMMSVNGPVLGTKAADIRKALIAELSGSTFICSYTVSGVSSDSTKDILIDILKSSEVEISMSQDNSQPVIIVKDKVTEMNVLTLGFTTSSDFKKVTSIDLLQEKITSTDVNVGTLIDPKFETQLASKIMVKGTCSVK